MSKAFFVIIGIIVGLFVGFKLLSDRAIRRMEVLASLVSAGQERLMVTSVRTTLSHLAIMLSEEPLKAESCKKFESDLYQSNGLFAVIAVGDMQGNAICTADSKIKTPLPTMNDRLYYQRVKSADGLVVGEYTVSKSTGKPVVHFAYPITDSKGSKKGFVMVGVDLSWFVSTEVNEALRREGVEIMGVDRNGKILFVYPSYAENIGRNSLSAPLIAAMLSGDSTHTLSAGYDGKYRVYSYRWSGKADEEIAIVSSIKLENYLGLWIFFGLFGAAAGWIFEDKIYSSLVKIS